MNLAPRSLTRSEGGAVNTAEREDLIASLETHRAFLLQTVEGLSDRDASRRTTVSELCLGGLVKHVAMVERQWVDFVVNGPGAIGGVDDAAMQRHAVSFRMDGESLRSLVDAYRQAAERTDTLVRSLGSLDASQPLPEAPWFEPGGRWSARRVLLHVIAETAQHAGHADIIREALDGRKTMG